MNEAHVVTVFLRNAGEVLLLRRAGAVGPSRGRWNAVAGPAGGDPDEAARRAIREETGLRGRVSFVRRGEPFPVQDAANDRRRRVHPFLFDCDSRAVAADRETDEREWCPPSEIRRRETVPELWTAYDRVRPTVDRVATDAVHGSTYVGLRALEVLRDEAALAADWNSVAAVARALLDARPAMRAVENRVNRAMSEAERTPGAVERGAMAVLRGELTADDRAAETAADRVGGRVLTLSRSGTVLAALRRADPEAVWVAVSEPGGEGRDAAEELAGTYDVTLFPDSAAARVLATEAIEAVLVGADAVLADGAVVNKVGTRGVALAAAREGVPCYAVAASAKVAADAEARDEDGPPRRVYDGEAPIRVLNPTFDATPADLVAGVATERGLLDAEGIREVAAEHALLAAWDD